MLFASSLSYGVPTTAHQTPHTQQVANAAVQVSPQGDADSRAESTISGGEKLGFVS
jgi:hypothetical protein